MTDRAGMGPGGEVIKRELSREDLLRLRTHVTLSNFLYIPSQPTEQLKYLDKAWAVAPSTAATWPSQTEMLQTSEPEGSCKSECEISRSTVFIPIMC